MRVVIAGSSGLIGTALVASLRSDNHDVFRLVRRPVSGPDEFQWSPERAVIDKDALTGADAVINLCGSSIGSKRWSGAYKQELRDSRITTTDVLADEVVTAGVATFVSASAINYYGDTGSHIVDESSSSGTGFLSSLCVDWEAATETASAAGVRTVMLRSAVVLTARGGMLGRLKPLYSLGLGGRLGSGRQYFPWISMADEIGAIKFALGENTLSGPVNLAGPAPITNAEFNKTMGQVVHRPAPWIVPGVALQAILGEIVDEAILHGPRAIPSALENAGYTFRHNTIREALDAVIGS